MDKKTSVAIAGSIKKWEGIVALTIGDRGMVNCPLCKVFYNHTEDGAEGCDGCPVKEKRASRSAMARRMSIGPAPANGLMASKPTLPNACARPRRCCASSNDWQCR